MSNDAIASAVDPAPIDPQLDAAREAKNVWEFEGKEYARFVVNRTGNIAIPIMHPVNKTRMIARIGADFMWSDDQVFFDHLNLKVRDERNVRDDETIRKNANLVTQNANLFKDTAQSGWIEKFDEFGESSGVQPQTRSELLARAPEIQSSLIDAWLAGFSVERYFPEGTDDIDALLGEPESIFFTGKIGDYKNPAHVLLLEFKTPTAEARRSFESDTLVAGTHTEGNVRIDSYMVNNRAKLKFARKYLIGVQGASLGPDGAIEIDDVGSLYMFQEGNTDRLDEFKKMFNPHWMIRLADSLADSFNLGGK